MRQRWQIVALSLGVLVPLVIFGTLAEDVWTHRGVGWDMPLLHAIHSHAAPALDGLMVGISTVGGVRGQVPLCAIVVLLLLLRRRRRQALFVVLAYGGAAALDALAKAIFHRARPHVWPSLTPETDYGFPSGHAMGSIGLLAALVVVLWPTRWRWPALVMAVVAVAAIGLSRLYLGVHFPSDVLAAWMAGLAWVIGLHLIVSRLPAQHDEHRHAAPLRHAPTRR